MSKFNLDSLLAEEVEEQKQEVKPITKISDPVTEEVAEQIGATSVTKPKGRPKAKPEPEPEPEQENKSTNYITLDAAALEKCGPGRKKAFTCKRVRLTIAVPEKLFVALDLIAPGNKTEYIVDAVLEKVMEEHPELKDTEWYKDFEK